MRKLSSAPNELISRYPSTQRVAVVSRCCFLVPWSKRGNLDSAEAALRELIDLEVAEWGWHHHSVLAHLATLERWLTEWGRVTEAAEIEGQISEILSLSDVWV